MIDHPHTPLRRCAFGLLGITVIGALALLHHPSFSGGVSLVEAERAVHASNVLVHGTALLLLLLQALILLEYTHWRGWRFLTRSAALSMVLATVVMSLAPAVSGFLLPALISASPADVSPAILLWLSRVMFSANQYFTLVGTVLYLISTSLYSLDAYRSTPRLPALAGVGALLVLSGLPALLVLQGKTDVRAIQIVWLLWSAWLVTLALSVLSRTRSS